MASADAAKTEGALHDVEFNPLLKSRVEDSDEFNTKHRPPGSRASTVEPGSWWASSFRFCKSLGGSFSAFLCSFHRKPLSPAINRATAALWPMPMPYPRVFVHRSSAEIDRKEDQLQKAVNLLVASLDWLHLPRAQVCPEEVLLFRPLSKVQWRVVKFMEQALAAWQECEPVTSEAMGRSAGKVEDIESALGRLASLEYAVDDSLNEFLPEASGTSIASLSVLSSLLVCKSSQQERWLGISREFPRWLPRSLFPIGPISKVSRASILPFSWTTLAVGFFNVPLIMHSDLVRLQRIPPESEFLVQMKKFRSYWRSLTSQADLGPFGNVMF